MYRKGKKMEEENEAIDAKEYGIECRRGQEFFIYRKGGIVIWLY